MLPTLPTNVLFGLENHVPQLKQIEHNSLRQLVYIQIDFVLLDIEEEKQSHQFVFLSKVLVPVALVLFLLVFHAISIPYDSLKKPLTVAATLNE